MTAPFTWTPEEIAKAIQKRECRHVVGFLVDNIIPSESVTDEQLAELWEKAAYALDAIRAYLKDELGLNIARM